MGIGNAMAVVAADDSDAARNWYENLFDRPADEAPMDGLNIWRFPGGGGLMLTPGKSGFTSSTLTTEDLDKTRAELAFREIETSEPFGTPGVSYVATVTDPAGNQLALAQSIIPDE